MNAPNYSLRLPSEWQLIRYGEDGAMYRCKPRGLSVIISGGVELDGRAWIHVSLSRRSRMPTYDDLALVKRLFIGADYKAIMVFPPDSEKVNIHRYCLHLFRCVGYDPLPDFTRGSGSL